MRQPILLTVLRDTLATGLRQEYMHLPELKIGDGAEGGTRTPTSLSPLDPEPSASANSATSAGLEQLSYVGVRTLSRRVLCVFYGVKALPVPESPAEALGGAS